MPLSADHERVAPPRDHLRLRSHSQAGFAPALRSPGPGHPAPRVPGVPTVLAIALQDSTLPAFVPTRDDKELDGVVPARRIGALPRDGPHSMRPPASALVQPALI